MADTDSDGMPDGWEVTYSLNPLIDDSGEDADSDNYTNYEEYQAGTEPDNSESWPIAEGDANGDGDVALDDAVLLLQALVGVAPAETIYLKADANGDGRLGTGDVIFILQQAAGLD